MMHMFKIEFVAHYGTFNIYDMQELCEYTTGSMPVCSFPTKASIAGPSTPEVEADQLDSLKFWRNIQTGYAGVEFIGTFRAVSEAMQALHYRSNTNQNTNRLRSRIYNPLASRNFPYEELLLVVSVNEECDSSGPYTQLTNMTQLMHIVDMNDTPEINHPKDIYSYPFFCTKLSLQPECHFGQYFFV